MRDLRREKTFFAMKTQGTRSIVVVSSRSKHFPLIYFIRKVEFVWEDCYDCIPE